MNDELTVLFVSHSSGLCGAEKSLLDLVVGLKALNIKPVVLVPAGGPLVLALEEEKIDVAITPYRGWLTANEIFPKGVYRALFNLGTSIHLRGKLKSVPIDLIYTNTVYSPLGAVLSKLLRVPHIWHAREFVHEDLGARYDLGTTLSMKFIAQTAAKVICNSSAVYHKMAGHIPSEKLVVVYNGLRVAGGQSQSGSRKNLPQTKEIVRLCIVGSLHEGKGQRDAIRALSVLAKHGVKAELRLVGSGDARYTGGLKTLAAELGVDGQIRWEGFVSNPTDVYLSSDISLICSKCEAFGRTAVEAMAVGCPVIGTCSGGLPEIVEDEVNGLLYPPSDYQALAARILKLIDDGRLYQSISRNAIATAGSRFTLDRYVSEIAFIIRKAVMH